LSRHTVALVVYFYAVISVGLTHSADFHPLLVVFSPRRGEKTTNKKYHAAGSPEPVEGQAKAAFA
jgi:hypothetical protein